VLRKYNIHGGYYIDAMSFVDIINRKIRREVGDGVLDFYVFYDYMLMQTFQTGVVYIIMAELWQGGSEGIRGMKLVGCKGYGQSKLRRGRQDRYGSEPI
jgi:hypothetical protein